MGLSAFPGFPIKPIWAPVAALGIRRRKWLRNPSAEFLMLAER